MPQVFLTQLVALLHLQPDAIYCQPSSFAVENEADMKFVILAGTGIYEQNVGKELKECISGQILSDILNAFQQKKNLFFPDRFVIYCSSKTGAENLVYLEGFPQMSEWESDLLELFAVNIGVAFDNIHLNKQVEIARNEVIFTLGEIAENRSVETGHHVKRVAEIAKIIAKGYGLPEAEVELLHLAASVHDIGKMAIPANVLYKAGKVTPDEFEVIKTHASIGYEMMKGSKQEALHAGAIIARQHHEYYDGTGYPQKLKGEEIHLYSRIVALADVFDALGNRRIYKEAWSLDKILDYIKQQRGKQFESVLVDILLDNIDEVVKIREQHSDF